MSRFLMRMFPILLLLALALALSGGVRPAAAQKTYGISGRVINDLNGNGAADPGEQGLSGWLVVVKKMDRTVLGGVAVVAEIRTGSGGDYRLSSLAPGEYAASLPCDGQPAAQWEGTFTGAKRFQEMNVRSPSSESSGIVDFLVRPLADPARRDGEIVGRLVNDLDMDGIADRREPGLAGWSVSMTRETPPLICLDPDESPPFRLTVTTDSKGVFRAEGLLEGTYLLVRGLRIRPPQDGSKEAEHWAVTAPIGFPTSETRATLKADKMRVNVDDTLIALLGGSGSISGTAFRDLNGNLTRDEGEPAAYPRPFALLYAKGPSSFFVYPFSFERVFLPSPDGRYEFEGLAAGKYIVSAYASVSGSTDKEFRFGPFDVGKGEIKADLPFPPLPPAPTPAPRPTQVPRPTPVRPVDVYAPGTGVGGTSSGSGLTGLAAALAVAGVLAVGASAVARRGVRLPSTEQDSTGDGKLVRGARTHPQANKEGDHA